VAKLNIGISGGGIGGFSAAIALRKMGHNVEVFEQAQEFNRVGADINLTPNAVFALDQLGVGETLRETAARPAFRISRDGITGKETSRLPMSDAAEKKYGAPQLTIHRADLLQALQNQLPADSIHLGKGCESVTLGDNSSTINFQDGTAREFDLVIGADGVHSAVRLAMFGKDDPSFTGIVSYRAVFPRAKADGIDDLDSFTKWWGEIAEKQIVTFPLTRGEEIFVFATTPQDDWKEEGWTIPGDVKKLQAAYENFHPDAQKLLAACTSVTCSALHVREPMDQWSKGHATIMGDAAHPMVPFMAQGACMAIEDAVILARSLEGVDAGGIEAGLAVYEAERKPRTAKIQRASLANEWMKGSGNADWVYGYDAWHVPLNH